MKSKLIVLALMAALLGSVVSPSFAGRAGAAAPAVSVAAVTHAHPAAFDKTRFLLHMGVAFYAFHHFVYARYRNGLLNTSHKLNLIKAGIALLFAYHEVKVAYNIANNSSSPTLQALVMPLNALGKTMSSIGNRLHNGQYNSSDIQGLSSQIGSFGSRSSSNGLPIRDVTAPIPGAA